MAKNTDSNKRVPTGPLGTPQGKHSDMAAKADLCRCGRCSNKLLGWPKPVVVTFPDA